MDNRHLPPPLPRPPISWEDGMSSLWEWCRIHRLRDRNEIGTAWAIGPGLKNLLKTCGNTAQPIVREDMEHLFDPVKSNHPDRLKRLERPQPGDTPEWAMRPLGADASVRTIWSIWQAISRAVANGVLDGGNAIAPNGRPIALALLKDVTQQENRRLTDRSVRVVMDCLAIQGRISDDGLLGTPFWTHPWVDDAPKEGGFGYDDAEHLNVWTRGMREHARQQKAPSDIDLDVLALLVLVANPTAKVHDHSLSDGRDRIPLLAHPFVEVHGERLMQSIGRIIQEMPHLMDEDDEHPQQTEMRRLSLMMRCAQGIYRTLDQRPGGWTDREAWGFWRRVRNNLTRAMEDMVPNGPSRVQAAQATCESAIPDGLVRRDRLILMRSGSAHSGIERATHRRRV